MGIRVGRVAANRLRVWRAERHVTQFTLAEKSRIPQSRISLIENRHADAKPDERARLARALAVEVKDIFPESGEDRLPPVEDAARDQPVLPFAARKTVSA